MPSQRPVLVRGPRENFRRTNLVMPLVTPSFPPCGLLRGRKTSFGAREVVSSIVQSLSCLICSRVYKKVVPRTGSKVQDLGSHLSGPDYKGGQY